VGASAIIGSLIPILPFFFLNVKIGMVYALILSIATLFIVGAVKAKVTIGSWKKNGFEMAAIGTIAALAGYVIGSILGVVYL